MPNNPQTTLSQLESLLNAWESLAPERRFGGLSLAEFKERVRPSREVRDRIAALENQMKAELGERARVDRESRDLRQRVVHSVRADPEVGGEDGSLYEAMGYVRKSRRATGLTRKPPPGSSSS